MWDNRAMRAPVCEVGVGGGVWRVKWHPHYPRYLLAACMHNGFKVLKFTQGLVGAEVVCSYDDHESLAYGTDWLTFGSVGTVDADVDVSLEQVKSTCMVGSCSFYDKLLTVWSLQ